VKAVFFDLDETILDRAVSLRRFANWQGQALLGNASSACRFAERFIELDHNGTIWKDEVYRVLVEEFSLVRTSISKLLSSYLEDFQRFCSPSPGIIAEIRKIHAAGLQLGLITNGRSPFQEENFAALGIAELFGTVVVSDAVGFKKPQEEIFYIACERLKLRPEECIHVGDNPAADIDGANAVGMYTIYIPGVFGRNCENASAVCNDMSELADIVLNAH
jgi:putative hydrolase of the HAD superfamily